VGQILELEVDLLQPNPLQVRSLIKSESLVDLVESIKEHGILEPLVVAKTPAGFQLIAGERRWRASKIVGLKRVPVVVRETTARGMLEMALVENVQRENLNPIERAQGFQRLLDEFGLGVTEISKRVGKSPAYVSNTLRLLTLPDAIKDGLISQDITEGHARAIAGLGDLKLMVNAYKTILSEGASVRRAEDLARQLKETIKQKPRTIIDKIYSSELETIAQEIGVKTNGVVKISQSQVSARVLMVFKGPIESTTEIIREIRKKLAS